VDARAERIAARFELPMLGASVLVIPIIAIEQSDAGEPWDTVAAILNWTTWAAFPPAPVLTQLAARPVPSVRLALVASPGGCLACRDVDPACSARVG
jgi:hypothetical protein